MCVCVCVCVCVYKSVAIPYSNPKTPPKSAIYFVMSFFFFTVGR